MTVADWLRSRTPAPPAALTARLDEVLSASLHEPAARVPIVFLEAGEQLAAELLLSNSTSRGSALDLLAADALVTYAFEAAGEMGSGIDARAEAAMQRISIIGAAQSIGG